MAGVHRQRTARSAMRQCCEAEGVDAAPRLEAFPSSLVAPSLAYVRNLPVKGSSRTVRVKVHPCSSTDFRLWHLQIRPHCLGAPGARPIGWEWNWPQLFIACGFSEKVLGRQALALQLRVASGRPGDEGRRLVPVAQALLSLPYPWPGDSAQDCVFVWFVAKACDRALAAAGVLDTFSVLGPMLDTAVQVSLARGLDGRIGLHAALGESTSQSDDLAALYESLGLSRRTQAPGYFRFPHRPDDGRLFYLDPAGAALFAQKRDHLR